jgi:TP901 family phage tail tape measure protein
MLEKVMISSSIEDQTKFAPDLEKFVSDLGKDRAEITRLIKQMKDPASDTDFVNVSKRLDKIATVLERFVKAAEKDVSPSRNVVMATQGKKLSELVPKEPVKIDPGVAQAMVREFLRPVKAVITDVRKEFKKLENQAAHARQVKDRGMQKLFKPEELEEMKKMGIMEVDKGTSSKALEAYGEISKLEKQAYTRIQDIARTARENYNKVKTDDTEKAAKESAQAISNSVLDAGIAWKKLAKSGELTKEQMELLKRGTDQIKVSTLMAPVASSGAQKGYHAKSLNMPFGTFMHQQMTADVLTEGYKGPKTLELKDALKGLTKEKDPKLARQAMITAGGLHDLSKYDMNMKDFKYVADHARQAAEKVEEEMGKQLRELYGPDYGDQVIDAIRLHHLRPGHIDRFIERQVEVGKKSKGEKFEIEKTAMPDYIGKIGELWQTDLSQMDLPQLQALKERLNQTVVAAVRAADGMLAGMIDAMPDPDTFFDVMESARLIDPTQRAQIAQLSEESKKQLQKYTMDRMSYGDAAFDIDAKLEDFVKEVGQTFPHLISDMSSKVLKDWGQLIQGKKEELGKIGIPTHQLKAQLELMGISLKSFRGAPKETLVRHPHYQSAAELGIQAYQGVPFSSLDPTQKFIQQFGDINRIRDPQFGLGVPYTEFKQNLMEEFSSMLTGTGTDNLREDMVKAFIIDPNILRPLLESLRDENDREIVRALETKLRKFYDQAIMAVEKEGQVNPFQLMTHISEKTNYKIQAAPSYKFSQDISRVGGMRLGDAASLKDSGLARGTLTASLGTIKEVNELNEKFIKLMSFEGFESKEFPKFREMFKTFFSEVTGRETGSALAKTIEQHKLLMDVLMSEARAAKLLAAQKGDSIEGGLDGPTLSDQWATKTRLARARGVVEEYERLEPHEGIPTLLTEKNLAFLKTTMAELAGTTVEYTQAQIENSKIMDKIIATAREENKHKFNNQRGMEKQESLTRRLTNERLREAKAQEEQLRTSEGLVGRGRVGGSARGGGGGGGVYGQGGLPFMMGGGGQGGWIMRQMAWQLAGPVIGSASIFNVVKQSVEAVKEQEVALINLRRVFSGANEDLFMLGNNITRLAVKYASVITDVGKIQEMWAKTGKDTAQQIDTLSRVTLVALNTSDIENADEAVRFLNSSLMQMGLGWQRAEELLDSWNKTADRFPAATKDFAEGYARAGSYAKALEMDIHQLNGVISILVERTGRAGGEVGTALRMMLSNIHRPQTLKTLQTFGIDPYEAGSTTRFRPFMDVLGEMAAKYKELEIAGASASKVLLASTLGQARRRNYAIALLDAWEGVEEVMETSRDSMGYSGKKMELTMESLAAKGRQLQAAFHEAAVSMGEAGLAGILKELTVTGTKVLTWFNDLDPAARNTISWMVLMTGVLTTLNTILKQTRGISLGMNVANLALGLGSEVGFSGASNVMRNMAEKHALKIGAGGVTKMDLAPHLDQMFKMDLTGYKELAPLLRTVAVEKAAMTVATTELAAAEAAYGLIQSVENKALVDAATKIKDVASARLLDAQAAVKQTTATLGAARAAKVASFWATAGIIVLVSLIALAASHKKNEEDRLKRREEEMRQTREQVTNIRRLMDTERTLLSQKKELIDREKEGEDVTGSLASVQSRLNNTYLELGQILPEAINKMDEQGRMIAETTKKTRKLILAKEELFQQDLKEKAYKAKEEIPKLEKELESKQERFSQVTDTLDKLRSARDAGSKYASPTGQVLLGFPAHHKLDPDYEETGPDKFSTGRRDIDSVITRFEKERTKLSGDVGDIMAELIEFDAILEQQVEEGIRDLPRYEEYSKILEGLEGVTAAAERFSLDLSENIDENTSDIAESVDLLLAQWDRSGAKTAAWKLHEAFLRRQLESEGETEVDAILGDKAKLLAWFDDLEEERAVAAANRVQEIKAEAERARAIAMEELEVLVSELAHIEEMLADPLKFGIDVEDAEGELDSLKLKIETIKGGISAFDAAIEEADAALRKSSAQQGRGGSGTGGAGDPYAALNKRLAITDHQLKMLAGRLSLLDEVWKSNTDSITYQTQKMKLLHEEEQELIKAHKQTGAELATLRKNSGAHGDKIRDLEGRYQDFTRQIMTTRNSIYELGRAMDEVKRKKFEETIKRLDNALSDVELSSKILAGGLMVGADSFEMATIEVNALTKSLDLLLEKEKETMDEVARIEGEITEAQKLWFYAANDDPRKYAEGRLTQQKAEMEARAKALREELDQELRNIKTIELARIEAEANVRSFITQMVTTGYQKALENEIEALEDKMEAAKDSHDQWVKNERKRLDILRRGWAEEDFDKKMEEMERDLYLLRCQYDRLSLDSSAWAHKRRLELHKDITDKEKELAEAQEQKRRDDLTQEIEDGISEKEEALTGQEKIWDDERKGIEKHYKELQDNAAAKIQGIFLAWKKYKFDVIDLLKSMSPEIGAIAEDWHAQVQKGLQIGTDFAKETGSTGGSTGGTSRTSIPLLGTYPEGDTSWIGARRLGDQLGLVTHYDKDTGKLYINNKDLTDLAKWVGNELHVPVRSAADRLGYNTHWDSGNVTLSKYTRGGVTEYEGLHYLHKKEMVLPERYTNVMDSLANVVNMPRPKIPDLSHLQTIINNNIQVDDVFRIEKAYFSDEVDLDLIERQGAARLKRSLYKKGIKM